MTSDRPFFSRNSFRYGTATCNCFIDVLSKLLFKTPTGLWEAMFVGTLR